MTRTEKKTSRQTSMVNYVIGASGYISMSNTNYYSTFVHYDIPCHSLCHTVHSKEVRLC